MNLAQQSFDQHQISLSEQYIDEAMANADFARVLSDAEVIKQALQQETETFENTQRELEWREPINLQPLQ